MYLTINMPYVVYSYLQYNLQLFALLQPNFTQKGAFNTRYKTRKNPEFYLHEFIKWTQINKNGT